jgi:glycosyltransferase involved in cell wall biosynthesis
MSYRQRLLIINPRQFGYHLGTYYHCKWARADFRITHIGFDMGRPKLALAGVALRYVSRRGGLLIRNMRFLGTCLAECRRAPDLVFIKYFPGCSLLRLLHPRVKFVLDIRSGTTGSSVRKRRWLDRLLRWESVCFRHVTIISSSLAAKLRLPLARVHILPLGADPVPTAPKEFFGLRLLYVGTLSGRRLDDTIRGFHRFYAATGRPTDVTYDILGDGYNGEVEQLRALVKELGLDHVVSLPGFVHHRELGPYFEKCNIGVSYVPRNEIYDCQPPTKTFEYLLAGLPVVATNTFENAAVITARNGLLIDDTPAAFYEALKKLRASRVTYCSDRIRQEALVYSWERIVRSNLVPYLHALLDH